ncbi:MAG: phosphosulfolactate synthase [Gammaproteobacteria bacterium CG11_big_fil_rev_8_21_14_0_20_46_22]|nr:MAG: phosphosulfolactate synthase [Gammaproteobacteria bacterium CG12_big_fil_rev_8_21_14_0_65_46_12]PIR12119.1 MAG: phosphosulfolactate synthase [Gammaproteobacteria bacterium CG11_big_fil_rev_8_21_14_0_20_46_22]
MFTKLNLPKKEKKPRTVGLNALIDNGYPLGFFKDVIESFSDKIDFIKFGWGTSVVTPFIEDKIKIAQKANIEVFMGGTLFEKYLLSGALNEYIATLRKLNIKWVEVSNGTINLSNTKKAEYIKKLSQEFKVLSEVGFKDSVRSIELQPSKWIEYIEQDFDAGSEYVITEARESGTSGICRSDGEVRFGLINEIASSAIKLDRLIFEAPNKHLQVYFITHFGPNVNLANIAFADVIPLETLRYGLRSDTLMLFEPSDLSEVE